MHPTERILQEYLDGVLAEDERAGVTRHLESCPECRRSCDAFRKLDRTLRRMPIDRAPSDLTLRVLRSLGIAEAPSFLWAIFKNVAPVFGLAVVALILWFVLGSTGTLEGGNVGQSVEATQSMVDAVRSGLGAGFSSFSRWIQSYLSFAFAKNTYLLTTFLLLFLGVVALLDRFVLMPLFRRRAAQSR